MTSTIYRFTPPTCTLELKGNKSPLSRWTNQDILKNYKFNLKFDDPQKPTARQVTIQGNQQDLSQLQAAVDRYLRHYLHSVQTTNTETNLAAKTDISDRQPYLKSQGLIHHELFFGRLIHDSNSDRLQLTTVQLFDLVSVLESYRSQVAILPKTKASKLSKIIPLWGGIAAAAIAAIGIATMLLKSAPQSNTASFPEPQSKPQSKVQTQIPELEEITPPSAPDRRTVAQPKLKEPLASAQKLPPPPAVDTPKPKPDIPDPADYPLSDVARQSGFKNSIKQKSNADRSVESTIIVPTENQAESESTITTAKLEEKLRNRNQIGRVDEDSDSNISDDSSIKFEANSSAQNSDLAATSSPAQLSQNQEVINYFQAKWQPPAESQAKPGVSPAA